MESESIAAVEVFFFPFVGGGHQIPMVDMARIFAHHGANSTILSTPKHALPFQDLINRDQSSGLSISIHILNLPENVDIVNTDMSASPQTDTSILQESLQSLLLQRRPDCIIHDMFHRWCADTIDSYGVTRIIFSGNACFARCVQENVRRYKPYENVSSDSEPFVVPGLPDKIEFTKSQLPGFFRNQQNGHQRRFPISGKREFGVVVNSFYELEPAYAEYFRNEMGNKSWLVGPVSLCNNNVQDKVERGKKTSMDEQRILSWLDGQTTNSVLYISFGSIARLTTDQLVEVGYGLEASNVQFIWVVGRVFKSTENDQTNQESVLPSELEYRIRESGKGLIIHGWAPQLLILDHPAVGGFMTHCGWNSTLEGVSAGVPMITWPISAEQFDNEKLIADVLKTGVKAGSMHWTSWNDNPPPTLGRDEVETVVKRLMGGGEKVAEMRRRAQELAEKAKKAIEEGGSSHKDVDALIQELKSTKKVGNPIDTIDHQMVSKE